MKKLLIILLCLVLGTLSYFGTRELDKLRKGGEVNLTVTFDDTETYVIPSVVKMDKEKALQEWPYIMEVTNTGKGKGLYQIIITDTEKSTIKRENLSYALYLDDKEIQNGELIEITKNILYTGSIDGNKTQKYKLYIWVSEEVEKDSIYEYKLEFNTIKEGGPGF